MLLLGIFESYDIYYLIQVNKLMKIF